MRWALEQNTIMNWADKLRKLLLRPFLSQEIVMRSKEWAESNFSVYNTAEQMALCYETIIH